MASLSEQVDMRMRFGSSVRTKWYENEAWLLCMRIATTTDQFHWKEEFEFKILKEKEH